MPPANRPPVLASQRFQQRAAELSALPIDQVFTAIHDSNLWGAEGSVSGLGSELDATATLRAGIPALLSRLAAGSLLDIPCGDFAWLSRTHLPVSSYIGADIVPALVEQNRARYGGDFRCLDLCSSPLPCADVVLCRDCLVHLSFAHVFQAIANLKRSGSTWLLTTTFLECAENLDIVTGDWRMLNFELAPFHWPKPEAVIVENCTEAGGGYADKALALWRLASLA